MKQILQNYKTGELQRAEVPTPTHARRGRVLVATCASLVSVGTEKYMLELAQKSLLGKALARPDLVRQVIANCDRERGRGGAGVQGSRGARELGSKGEKEQR